MAPAPLDPPTVRAGRAKPSLAVWVSAVSLLALLPMLAFSALMLYRDIVEQQRQGIDALGRRATSAAAAVSHHLDGVFSALGALELTDGARRGDLQALHHLAVRTVEADPRLASISLSAPSGHQPFITTRPFGSDLPESNAAAMLLPLFQGAERVVSPLVTGAVSGQQVVGVARRIDLGPAGVFAIRGVVRLDTLGARFNEQHWPSDWTAAIIDQDGIIIARSRDAARYVGQPATPGLLESLTNHRGAFRSATKDGVATVATGAPVPGTGWHVVVGQPAAALDAQVRDSLVTMLMFGALCAGLGIAGALYTARTIGRQLRSVVATHVGGASDAARITSIKEIEEVDRALAEARAARSDALGEAEAARRDALMRLEQRGEMLDVLAHEVRQPLNNAAAALQQANAAILSKASPEIMAPLLRANAVLSQVLASIDNTLAVAAQLVGDKRIQRVDFDIDSLVKLAIADMATAEAPRVRIERCSSTRTATGDPHLLRLALRNLLSNALKFSPRGSPVTVRIADSDEPLAVVFDVTDGGAGVEEDLLPRLFDRGGRTGQPLGGRRQGLGLYIVRRVMQLHGGAVTLESTGAGGTTMRLTVVQLADE